MKTFARIENGIVREPIVRPDAFDITKSYHPSLISTDLGGKSSEGFILVPDGTAVSEGDLYDGAVFSRPPPPPPPPPDPNVSLDTAIDGAATLSALKAVLRGRVAAR